MRLFTLQLSLFFLLFFVHVEASSSWLDVLDKLDVNDINHWNFQELSSTTRPPTQSPKTTKRSPTRRATKVKRTRRLRSSKTTPTPTRPTTRPTTKITHRPTTRPTTKRSTTTRARRTRRSRPTTKRSTTQRPTTKRSTTQRPTTKRSTTQRPTTKRSTTQRPTTKRPTTTRRARRTRRTRRTRGTNPRPTTKKTTTKRSTPKKTTTKRSTPKRTTPKRVTPKKATTKRVTPKKATTKRVTPKKATTKRVTTKRSTTQRATTPTRTIRLNTKPWKFKPIVFPGGVRQVTRKPLQTRKPHPTSPYPEFPQKSDVSIHDIVKNFKLNSATRRTSKKRTAPLRDLANDREQLERNAKAEEKAKEDAIRRKIEDLRRRIQQQSHLATRPGPTTRISKLSPHTHRPTTTTVITTRPTTTRPTTTRHTNIPLKQLPIAEQQRLELEHLRQRRVEAEERLAKLKQKFEADKKNHERKQIIRENPNNALHPETPRPARVESGPQAASWPRVNPEELKRAQEEQAKREAAIREKFKGQPPSHHYLSVLSSLAPTTRRPTGRPNKDEANLRRFLSQIKSQSPNNNDPYFLVAQKTKSHNPVVLQLSQDSWRLLKQLKSQVSSDGWLDLARHLVKFGKSEEK